MRAARIVCGIACAVTAVVAAFTISYDQAKLHDPTPISAHPAESSPESSLIPLYIVKAYRGHVAVFRFGQTAPIQELEHVRVENLPAHDQSLLMEGVEIYAESDLQALMEDLDS